MPPTTTTSYREKALIEAMGRCGGFLFNFLRGLCGEDQMAEDLLQKLWGYVFDKYEEEDFCHVGFLQRKAYQLYVDEMRKKDSRPVLDRYEELPEKPALYGSKEPSNSNEEIALYEEFWEQFEALNLDEMDKSLFWYHVRFGFTIVEVGERFNVPKSTVHDRIKEVRRRCMLYLEAPYKEEPNE